MPNPITIFTGSTGINTKVDPTRLRFDSKTGISDFAAAINVDIDDTGRPSRRKGSTRVLTGNWHSLFDCREYALGVTGDALSVIEYDFSSTPIRNVTPAHRMRYLQVEDKVYYANGTEKGYVQDRVSHPWVAGAYVGPPTTKTFSDPPVGTILEIYNSRVYIVIQSRVKYSARNAHSWYNLASDGFRFANDVTMLRAINDGIYVGTTKETLFLSGAGGADLRRISVADYGVIEGTDVIVPGSRVAGGKIASSPVAMWTSSEGICMGGPEGLFINLTEKKLSLPSARYGSAIYKDGKYIVCLEP